MAWEWKLTERNCPGCGICADLCLHTAIAMTREMAYPKAVSFACVGCMLCVDQCPFGAIEVNETASVPGP